MTWYLKMKKTVLYSPVLIPLTISIAAESNAQIPDREQVPNILIITVDNIGYGDLRAYNARSLILTPHIDRLAESGAILTSFYTASPTCSASRAALLTGRIPQRNKLDYQLPRLAGNYGTGLRRSEILIPQVLRKAPVPYTTGAFGKWNIGFAPASRPTERGFDEFLGIASGNADHFTHVYSGENDLYHNTESVSRQGEYSTALFANEAIRFINENTSRSKPWFVYLPFDAPHYPSERNIDPDEENMWKAPDYAFKAYNLSPDEKDPVKRFRAVVTAVDMAVGRLLKTLDSLGIADNTFIFFFSDNGAFYPQINSGIQSNLPLRGAGVTLWEGGIRVPAIARWPGKIKAGSVIDTRLWSLDLFPACALLAGAELPQDRFIDGKNPLPVLTGRTDHSPHATLFFEYEKSAAFHWGNWKIIRESPEEEWQLYNLGDDISESSNLAGQHIDLVKKLSTGFDFKKEEIQNYLKIEGTFMDE